MTSIDTAGLPAPTQDERTFALLTHILGMFSGFVAPLIFFLVKRDSRFVSFHALQVLIWHIVYTVLMIVAMMFFFFFIFANMIVHPPGPHAGGPPPLFFVGFGFVWLFGMGGWIINLVLGIVYALKANRGEWARYPIFGDWAFHWVLRNPPANS